MPIVYRFCVNQNCPNHGVDTVTLLADLWPRCWVCRHTLVTQREFSEWCAFGLSRVWVHRNMNIEDR